MGMGRVEEEGWWDRGRVQGKGGKTSGMPQDKFLATTMSPVFQCVSWFSNRPMVQVTLYTAIQSTVVHSKCLLHELERKFF